MTSRKEYGVGTRSVGGLILDEVGGLILDEDTSLGAAMKAARSEVWWVDVATSPEVPYSRAQSIWPTKLESVLGQATGSIPSGADPSVCTRITALPQGRGSAGKG